jgi:hypothetical protein
MPLKSIEDHLSTPGPLGCIAHTLVPYLEMIRRLAFLDNEYGDATNANMHLQRRVFLPVRALLERHGTGSRFKIYNVEICKEKLHTLRILYNHGAPDQAVWSKPEYVYMSIYTPSDKARAVAAKAEREGEDLKRGAPRRGSTASTTPARKPRRKSPTRVKQTLEHPANRSEDGDDQHPE